MIRLGRWKAAVPYLASPVKKYWSSTSYDVLGRPKIISTPFEDSAPEDAEVTPSYSVTNLDYTREQSSKLTHATIRPKRIKTVWDGS